MASSRGAISPVRVARFGVILLALPAGLGGRAAAAAPSGQALTSPAPAATSPAVAATPPAPAPLAAATTQPVATAIPALTPVKLEITKELSTKVCKEGDTFALRLAEPITVNGTVVVPAGAEGTGEVIESKRGGMAGGAGVLILAARYLVVDGRHLRLRSLRMAQTGKDNRGAADAIAFAGGIPGSFIGFLIPGGGMTVAAGTIADAKTAEDFLYGATVAALPPAPLAAAAPARSPIAATAPQTFAKGSNAQ